MKLPTAPTTSSAASLQESAIQWSEGGLRAADLRHIFDHLPDVVFFIKDTEGRYLAANRTLAERCGLSDPAALIGRGVESFFPEALAARYARQDAAVLQTGRLILDRLELHWHCRRREGWCLTTKLPLRDPGGAIAGLIGISRDLRAPGDKEGIPAALMGALDYLEESYGETLTPGMLAARAGLGPVKFARLIKRIFQLSPVQLIAQRRLGAAARVLRESRRTVAEVAQDCGFYDQSALARAFHLATGMTPTQYRQSRQARPSRK